MVDDYYVLAQPGILRIMSLTRARSVEQGFCNTGMFDGVRLVRGVVW